jgi:hypothetical protein
MRLTLELHAGDKQLVGPGVASLRAGASYRLHWQRGEGGAAGDVEEGADVNGGGEGVGGCILLRSHRVGCGEWWCE